MAKWRGCKPGTKQLARQILCCHKGSKGFPSCFLKDRICYSCIYLYSSSCQPLGETKGVPAHTLYAKGHPGPCLPPSSLSARLQSMVPPSITFSTN